MRLQKWMIVAASIGLVLTGISAAKLRSSARASSLANTPVSSKSSLGMTVGTPDLKWAGPLAFGPNNVLFVGDSQSAAVFALDVKDSAKDAEATPIEIKNIDQKIASLLGVSPDAVLIQDMAVHPVSQQIYLSVSRGRGADATPVILKANKKGELQEVSLKEINFSKAQLDDAPDAAAKTRWGASKRSMAITDLAYMDGEVFVAGLSNAEFESSLRRTPFPFKERAAATSVEIYHTSHDRYETQSPIETFVPFRINGKPSLLAGYGCAPIASFSLEDLKTKKHLRGVTLAELGGGNRPLDMIAFEKGGKRRVLIANSDRTLMSMSAEDIEKGSPLTRPVDAAYVSAGVPYISIAEVGVRQLDNLNEKFVVVIQRGIEDGSLNLHSIPKNWL